MRLVTFPSTIEDSLFDEEEFLSIRFSKPNRQRRIEERNHRIKIDGNRIEKEGVDGRNKHFVLKYKNV